MALTETKSTCDRTNSPSAIRAKKKQIRMIYIHAFTNLLHQAISTPIRTQYMMGLLNGNQASTARLLAYSTSGSALIEFFFNPSLGKLSDHIGRKFLLLLSPILSFVCKILILLKSDYRLLMLERTVFNAANVLAGSTGCKAALTDLCEGEELAQAYGTLGAAQGLGVLGGSMLSGILSQFGMSFISIYGTAAFIAFAHSYMVMFLMEESNKHKKPIKDFTYVNPFEFIKLFQTKSNELSKLMWSSAFMCFAEGKNIVDVSMNYIVNDCKCGEAEAAYMVSGFGVTMISSGMSSRAMLKRLGERLFTTWSNVVTIMAYYLWTRGRLGIWSGLVMMVVCQARQAAVLARSTVIATGSDVGYGKGEFQGMYANLRSLTVMIAPILYGNTYNYTKARGSPGGMYFVLIAMTAIGEVLHQLSYAAPGKD